MRIIYFGFLLLASTSFGQSVKTVKGTQVLINLEGATFTEGQRAMAKDANGKNRAVLQIKKVGKTQAIAEIVKGKAEPGYGVAGNRAPAAVNQSAASEEESQKKVFETLKGTKWGVLGSYISTTMNARYSLNGTNLTAAMSGTGFGVLGYYDMPYSDSIELRAMGGVEQFVAKQTRAALECDQGNSTNCMVSINYLSLYGLAKYHFSRSTHHIWGAGGFGYLTALSKSSTVLDLTSITSNQVLTLSIGADIALKSGVLPLSLDYSIFPATSTVSTSMMTIRAGWAWGI